MKKIKLISWNVNSIRSRIDHIKKIIELYSPDILCLQETKIIDYIFPEIIFNQMGFQSVLYQGNKKNNGVAIISKIQETQKNPQISFIDYDRGISCLIDNKIEIHNLYINAGGDVADLSSQKFYDKIMTLDRMNEFYKGNTARNLIICGDFNVAPMVNDVWSHKSMHNIVSHSEIEITKINSIIQNGNFIDIGRRFINADEKLFTWWSYRNIDWEKSNRGRRLDHIWCSKEIVNLIDSFFYIKETRSWNRPSDHIPIGIDIQILP